VRRRTAAAAGLLLAASLAGCSDGGSGEGLGEDGDREITVLAAASLTETFTALAEEFEAANPGVTVRLAFDSSATLVAQAVEGAPADVLATADTVTMTDAVDGGAVAGEPTPFATNVLTLVVPADNPAGITSFADLGGSGVDYVACVETAPCGAAAAALLEANDVDAEPASLETDVKAVLGKVVSDEADAGLVYVTDATAAADTVTSIEVPEASTQVLEYPVAVLEQARQPALAQAFVDLVLSSEGQTILGDAGFGAP
jgi:molybdate transport system substrate-binding protein